MTNVLPTLSIKALSLLLLLWLVCACALDAQQDRTFGQLASQWQADVQGFFRLQDEVRGKSKEEREEFYRTQGTDQRNWQRLLTHMSSWLRTPEGFEAARSQISDQLEPIGGFSLERYATVAARLTSGFELNDLLAETGVDEETWIRVQGGWGIRMGRDRARVLTTLYSHYFLRGLEGKFSHIAKDAAAGLLPGGKLSEPEPVSFERYVEIQAAVTAGSHLGLDAAQIPDSEFGLSFADWNAIANWWGVRMRTDEDRRYLMRMGGLTQQYQQHYEELFRQRLDRSTDETSLQPESP